MRVALLTLILGLSVGAKDLYFSDSTKSYSLIDNYLKIYKGNIKVFSHQFDPILEIGSLILNNDLEAFVFESDQTLLKFDLRSKEVSSVLSTSISVKTGSHIAGNNYLVGDASGNVYAVKLSSQNSKIIPFQVTNPALPVRSIDVLSQDRILIRWGVEVEKSIGFQSHNRLETEGATQPRQIGFRTNGLEVDALETSPNPLSSQNLLLKIESDEMTEILNVDNSLVRHFETLDSTVISSPNLEQTTIIRRVQGQDVELKLSKSLDFFEAGAKDLYLASFNKSWIIRVRGESKLIDTIKVDKPIKALIHSKQGVLIMYMDDGLQVFNEAEGALSRVIENPYKLARNIDAKIVGSALHMLDSTGRRVVVDLYFNSCFEPFL